MIKKYFKKILCLAFSATMIMGISTTTYAAETIQLDTIIEQLEPTIYYSNPQILSETNDTETLLISSEEIENLSEEEFCNFLMNNTPLDDEQIAQVIAYYQSEDYTNGVSPAYGLFDFPEWYIEPEVIDTRKMVVYATSWIGIDAYTSAVGMTKGTTEEKTITYSLGYSGSGEIKKLNNTLTLSYERSTTTTVSATQECPAWTTMNWRPYAVYWEDEYYGKMKITTIIPSAVGVAEHVWYDDHTGVDRRLIVDTTQVWSRVNDAHDLNAITPLPPTGAPAV